MKKIYLVLVVLFILSYLVYYTYNEDNLSSDPSFSVDIEYIDIPFSENSSSRLLDDGSLVMLLDEFPETSEIYDMYPDLLFLSESNDYVGDIPDVPEIIRNIVKSEYDHGDVHVLEKNYSGIIDFILHETSEDKIYFYALEYINGTYQENSLFFSRYGNYTNKEAVLVRYDIQDHRLVNEKVLLDDILIPSGYEKDGENLEFGPDDELYIALPDIPQKMSAQNLSLLAGKILRIEYDGEIPDDNPFDGSPVYSYGHMNPKDIIWDKSGNLFVVETNEYTKDQINKIVPGGNYGWDVFDCDDRIRDFEENLLSRDDVIFPDLCLSDSTSGPVRLTYVNDSSKFLEDFIILVEDNGIYGVDIADEFTIHNIIGGYLSHQDTAYNPSIVQIQHKLGNLILLDDSGNMLVIPTDQLSLQKSVQ